MIGQVPTGSPRRATEDPAVARLTREGADRIREWDIPFRRCGSLIIGAEAVIDEQVTDRSEHRWIDLESAARRVPLLEGATLARRVLETDDDGIVEVHALLQFYMDAIRAAGAEIRFGERVRRVQVESGKVAAVELEGETIACEQVVMASGAWGACLSADAGVPIELIPRRRHIVVTAPPADRNYRLRYRPRSE